MTPNLRGAVHGSSTACAGTEGAAVVSKALAPAVSYDPDGNTLSHGCPVKTGPDKTEDHHSPASVARDR